MGRLAWGVDGSLLLIFPLAHQPMANENGLLHIAFNAEIYNFQALRAVLERKGHPFQSDSDTETILQIGTTSGTLLPSGRNAP